MPVLTDPSAERAVLAGICEYGSDMYLDICDMVKPNSFAIDSNKVIFRCLEHLVKKDDNVAVDLPSIFSAASEIGVSNVLEKRDEAKHLNSILQLHVDRKNVRRFAAKIRKLEVTRLMHKQLGVAQDKLLEIQGTEPVAHILGIAEETVFDFSSLLSENESNPIKLAHNIEEYLDYLAENPVDQLGFASGFPKWDKAIGGGLRKGTLNVFGARPKTGKTLLADNIGHHVAKELNIPVLNLDTEMLIQDHQHRTLALSTGVAINDIETGKFSLRPDARESVYEAGRKLKEYPLYYKSIAGMPFEDQLSLMRRWVQREVGLHPDGTAKDCVIVYDYLKLMDAQGVSSDMKEYQLLGFMMTALHNFAVRYRIPFVMFLQLNRDGITKESTDAASGSDRIIWLCSNFTIFKFKSDEEIAEDGPEAGNRKLVVAVTRHGGGLDYQDYINCHMKGWCAQISEGDTKFEINDKKEEHNEGFVVDEQDDDIPFE